MAIIQKLKSLLGIGGESDSEQSRDVGVTVERTASDTADAGDETGTDTADDPVATETTAGGSTGSITDGSDDEPGATEPAEATGPTESAAAPTSEKTDSSPPDDVSMVDSTADATEETTEDETSEDESESETADESAAEQTDDSEETDGGTMDTASETGTADPLVDIKGIGPSYAETLESAGIETIQDLADADADELAAQTDISAKRIQGWIDQAQVR